MLSLKTLDIATFPDTPPIREEGGGYPKSRTVSSSDFFPLIRAIRKESIARLIALLPKKARRESGYDVLFAEEGV